MPIYRKTPKQALRADRPPVALSLATSGFLPDTQGQRSKDVSSLMGTGNAVLKTRPWNRLGRIWLGLLRDNGRHAIIGTLSKRIHTDS